MIITVGGIKGGTGKTTIATSLAILFANTGKDVLLVDADQQGTATEIANQRESTLGDPGFTSVQLTGMKVRTDVEKMKSKFEVIIIDAGGRDTASQRAALTVSDMFLVPLAPRSLDFWTVNEVVKLIEEMKPANPELLCFTILNKADSQGKDNDEAREFLQEVSEYLTHLDAPLYNRKAYANAAGTGLAVTEYKPVDKKAIAEMSVLFDTIQQHLVLK